MSDNQDAQKKFADYLSEHFLRMTGSRRAVIQAVMETEGHFDIESLYIKMKNHKYRVSRATLYNTMELLLACHLVTKHQFGNHSAQYEKAFKFSNHDHFISVDDGTVLEFCDPRIQEIQTAIEKTLNVEITHHSLIFYGHMKSAVKKPSRK